MTIDDVKKILKNIESLSKLPPEEYAFEGGIADTIANQKGEMKFTQLRKFFGHIKKIETTKIKGKQDLDSISKADIAFLMPELVYGFGRNLISKDFYEIMKICLEEKIKNVADFRTFVNLLSAIIAYYKMRK